MKRAAVLLVLVVGGLGCSSRRQHGRDATIPSVPTRGPLAQRTHYEQGKSWLRAGRPDLALAAFERAIAAAPRGVLLANCYLGQGSAYAEIRQHGKAVAAYRRVVALRPNDPEAHRTLALGLEEAGRLDEACQSLRQALALNPDQLATYHDLANLYLRSKDLEHAKEAYVGYEVAHSRLIGILRRDPDEKQRERAARALGEARDEATAKALGVALADPSPLVRNAVIQSLGEQRLSEGAGPLNALLEETRDPAVRRLIQSSLQAIASAPQPAAGPVPALDGGP